MLNYIKSELFRVTHTARIFIFVGTMSALSLTLNLVLALFGYTNPNFKYNTTAFSYSNLVANPMIFVMMGLLIAILLYEENRTNGNLKNTVAYGISRIKILTGQIIVGTLVSFVAMVVILAVYVISARLVLEPTGVVTLLDLITEVPAVFLIAVASLISEIVFMEVTEKSAIGIVIWVVIWYVIPRIVFYLGIRFGPVHSLASWMPANLFSGDFMQVGMSVSNTVWQTPEGMLKCILSGLMGIIIFYTSGLILLKRKEI